MANLPTLPEAIDPKIRYIGFLVIQCADCEEWGPVGDEEKDKELVYGWWIEHNRTTGHANSYNWNLSRARGRTENPADWKKTLNRTTGGAQ